MTIKIERSFTDNPERSRYVFDSILTMPSPTRRDETVR
jgi:hypothetical protein